MKENDKYTVVGVISGDDANEMDSCPTATGTKEYIMNVARRFSYIKGFNKQGSCDDFVKTF